MSEDDHKIKLERVVKLFRSVKLLILHAEEISGETYPQILLEQRDAFDHLMRAISAEIGVSDGDAEYVSTNLGKAYDHLYRAGYDALDWSGVILRDLIAKELSGISPSTILKVLPEYYREMKRGIVEIDNKMADLRNAKDIAAPNLNNFEEYLKLNNMLEGYYRKIIDIRPSLIEVENDSKTNKKRYWAITIGLAFASVVLGAVLGYVLSKY